MWLYHVAARQAHPSKTEPNTLLAHFCPGKGNLDTQAVKEPKAATFLMQMSCGGRTPEHSAWPSVVLVVLPIGQQTLAQI